MILRTPQEVLNYSKICIIKALHPSNPLPIKDARDTHFFHINYENSITQRAATIFAREYLLHPPSSTDLRNVHFC